MFKNRKVEKLIKEEVDDRKMYESYRKFSC